MLTITVTQYLFYVNYSVNPLSNWNMHSISEGCVRTP